MAASEKPEPVFTAHVCFILVQAVAGGVVALLLGVTLLTDPKYRDVPERLSNDDWFAGIGVILTGFLWLGVSIAAIWVRYRRIRNWRAQDSQSEL